MKSNYDNDYWDFYFAYSGKIKSKPQKKVYSQKINKSFIPKRYVEIDCYKNKITGKNYPIRNFSEKVKKVKKHYQDNYDIGVLNIFERYKDIIYEAKVGNLTKEEENAVRAELLALEGKCDANQMARLWKLTPYEAWMKTQSGWYDKAFDGINSNTDPIKQRRKTIKEYAEYCLKVLKKVNGHSCKKCLKIKNGVFQPCKKI